MAGPYVIVIDTLCTGWICERNSDTGEPVTYPTLEAACAEILSNAQDLWDNQDPDDLEGEARPETALDCEAFAVPIAEYIEGRKTIFTFDGLHVVGSIPDAPSPDAPSPDAPSPDAPSPDPVDPANPYTGPGSSEPVNVSDELRLDIYMCIWSAIEDKLLLSDETPDAARWKAYHDNTGVAQMRSDLVALPLGEATERAWLAFLGGDDETCFAWDIEFLPWFAENCLDISGPRIALYADYLTRAAFAGWQYKAKDIAEREWHYSEFIYDRDDKRPRQAFDAGESPAQYVALFAEKYDFINFD